MKFVKPEYLIRIFGILTEMNHKVEFVVNDENAVVMMVSEKDDEEIFSSTLFSVHNSQEQANNAKKTYEAAFAIYRNAMEEFRETEQPNQPELKL
ncbi:hypothetical protein [Enterobacter kobei]|uniref:hypothetical protein n=1 Tax=Enterobacter kobei TaxID=208224 RepID=UPI00201FCC99|nr:hypothetical protein [Enterobacter kobei]MCL8167142.1 hypothetical protein [Enterobacter kobei]MCM7795638.1 hypothetical protein [Enterobacter kobei]